jgi:2-phospho-L-lactate guanylyltransferase
VAALRPGHVRATEQMSPRVVVPIDVDRPKTRLAPVLDAEERRTFALAMTEDVLGAVRDAGLDPLLLATGPVPASIDAPAVVDDRSLTAAVNAVLATAFDESGEPPGPGAPTDAGGDLAVDAPVAVVMADLALATPAALGRLVATGGDVVLVPGRGGGTNALVARTAGFRVDYHGVSYRDHRRAAERLGATVGTVDSHRLSTDVDEPADLVEVLLHGEGAAVDWLRDAGFEVAVDEREGRVRATR